MKRKEKEQQDAEEKRKKYQRKRKRSVSCKSRDDQASHNAQEDIGAIADPQRGALQDAVGALSLPKDYCTTLATQVTTTTGREKRLDTDNNSSHSGSDLSEKSKTLNDFSGHKAVPESVTREFQVLGPTTEQLVEPNTRESGGMANSDSRSNRVSHLHHEKQIHITQLQRSSLEQLGPQHQNKRPGGLDQDETSVRSKFRAAKSLADLRNCTENFQYDESNRSFKCTSCTCLNNRPCTISYCARETDSDSIKSTKFRDLKKKLLDHLYTSSQHKAAIRAETSIASFSLDDPEFKAGMAVGRTAYGCVKKGSSYRDFESDLAMRSEDSLDIGNINHSASFASNLTQHFHDELHDRIKTRLHDILPGTNESPPFSIVCDKMTPSRTTLHNIGIVAPVDKGRLRATFLEARPSNDASGMGMAREIKAALRRVYSADDVRRRCTGMAVDGAYINCNIKEHFLDELNVPDEPRESYAVLWDPAHQLELAGKTSRQQVGSKIGVPWLKDTITAINHFSSKYGRGKGWKDIQEAHVMSKNLDDESLGKKATRLQNFSTTRFTTFAHRAISAVRKNWSNIHDCPDITKSDKSTLTDPKFILRMCAMEDAYSVISKSSGFIQSSRIYSWNASESLEACADRLTQMVSALRDGDLSSSLFPALAQATDELKCTGKYQRRSVKEAEARANHGDSAYAQEICQVRGEVAQNINNFVSELQNRQSQSLETATKVSREVFSFKKIMERHEQEVPNELKRCVSMYQNAGFISTASSYNDIETQYKLFVREVHKQSEDDFKSTNEYISKEEKIYSNLLSKRNPSSSFQTVVRMLATAVTQTHCEAVTEGWGSVLESRVRNKVNLDPEKLSQEVFIKLNGPPATSKCNEVVAGALDRYFGGRHKWHFYRSSKHIPDKSTSVVVQRLAKSEEGFPLNNTEDSESECDGV